MSIPSPKKLPESDAPDAPILRVLVVCMGNICRSPSAEVVLREKCLRHGLSVEVDSAGTENYHVGSHPDPRSIEHARRRGYDLSRLRARQVIKSDFEQFDWIFAADVQNLSVLRKLCPPHHHSKLQLFLGDTSLPDPYYGGAEGFEQVLDLVESRAEILVQTWQKALCKKQLTSQ